jgi:hypothetical protein
MKHRIVIGAGLLSCLVVTPAGSWARVGGTQVPGGMSLPGGLSKDSLLKQQRRCTPRRQNRSERS